MESRMLIEEIAVHLSAKKKHWLVRFRKKDDNWYAKISRFEPTEKKEFGDWKVGVVEDPSIEQSRKLVNEYEKVMGRDN